MSETDWKQARVALESLHDMAMKVSAYEQVRQIGAQIATVDAIIDIEARVAALEAKQPDSDGLFHDRVHRDVGRARPAMTVRQSEPAAEAPSDEAAAIAWLRQGTTEVEKGEKWSDGYVRLTVQEARHVLAALDRLTAQLADARSEAVALRATEENLRMQLAAKEADENESFDLLMKERSRAKTSEAELVEKQKYILQLEAEIAQLAARTDATPLGWVNVYPDAPIRRPVYTMYKSEREAREGAMCDVHRTVPVYEHAPRPVAPVSDDELMTAMGEGIHYEDGVTVGYDLTESLAALKKLLNRAAVAPDYELVGACVVDEGGIVAPFTYEGYEKSVRRYVAEHGGTAHRLYRGEPITTEGGR